MRGPNFICIGAQRSGTTWLHRVLEQHPQLWLTPVKEIHYFDGRPHKHFEQKRNARILEGSLSPWDTLYFRRETDDAWYCSLFAEAQSKGLLTGETTPAYALLEEKEYAHMRALNPDVKLIFIMRDPVERAWSGALMDMEKNSSANVYENTAGTRLKQQTLERSVYIDTVLRLDRIFPQDHIAYLFYDDLIADPASFIRTVLAFLGVDQSQAEALADHPRTRSTSTMRAMPPEAAYEYATQILPSLDRLCERFDGPPQKWREQYSRLIKG